MVTDNLSATRIKAPKKQKPHMIKIWNFSINEFDYSEYFMPNEQERDFFNTICKPALIKGEAIGKKWRPVIYIKRKQRKNPDFLPIAKVGIVITQKAVDVLKPLLGNSVELLPLRSFKQPMYFVNVLESLDCLDEDETIYKLSAVTKTKVGIVKFAFDPEKIADKHIFKIKGFWYNTFVSDEFRKICKENDLQGVDFSADELVWQQDEKL